MKTILAILILSMTLQAGGLLGFKFGQSYESVNKILIDKGITPREIEEKGIYSYDISSFGGVSCVAMILLANEQSQIIKAVIITGDALKGSAFNNHNDIVDKLTKKYGEPKKDKHFYLSPYEHGDGYAHQAFRVGKGAKYTSFKTEDMSIFIEAKHSSSPNFYLKISYEDTVLLQAYIDKKKKTDSEDM